ncbi:TPA: substrate-binding domain-containing protein [Salmonella enterica]|nr:substrate-binding domain-containing protein [Salmonella enterica]
MASKKPTISDVAKLANVSAATVSMVLSGKGRISTWTTQRINNAIEQLGYVRNYNAATLRSGKTGLIAVLIHGIKNKFNLEALQGVTANHDERNKVPFIMIYETDSDLENRINIALNYNVDGFLIISQQYTSEKVKKLLGNSNIPWIFISTTIHCNDNHYISIDALHGSRIATQYLIDKGHIHIAFVGGGINSWDRAEKLDGYFSVLQDNKIKEDKDIIIPDGETPQKTADQVEQLISTHPWITAILCYDSITTRGTLAGIKSRGRTIGKDNYIGRDISIIALEKIDEAEYISPSITCIDFSAYRLGWNAAQQLNNQIEKKPDSTVIQVPQPVLIVRESA